MYCIYWLKDSILLIRQLFPNRPLDSTKSLSKFQKGFLQKNIYTIGKQILKIRWKCRISRIVQITLKKKNKVRGLKLPDFKTYHRATVIKTAWCLPCRQTTRCMEQNTQKWICTSKGSFTKVIQQEQHCFCNEQGCNSENPCEVKGTPTFTLQHTHK